MKRIYIAGPMSSLPRFNYPAFNTEAARLRSLGYHVENPAENPKQPDWNGYMRQAIRQMLTCDMIAMLPGWEHSKGATLESFIARRVGIEIVTASTITEGSL